MIPFIMLACGYIGLMFWYGRRRKEDKAEIAWLYERLAAAAEYRDELLDNLSMHETPKDEQDLFEQLHALVDVGFPSQMKANVRAVLGLTQRPGDPPPTVRGPRE